MHSVNPGPFIGLVAVIGIFSIPILGIICHFGLDMAKAWLAIGLKCDMVARGYTAQEIVEVVAAEAGSKTRSFLPNVPPAKPVKQPAYSP